MLIKMEQSREKICRRDQTSRIQMIDGLRCAYSHSNGSTTLTQK